ncbi:MAG TPA: tetratricopeptide repeat protein [Leptolyngbyaceae cyanobacterium]
MSRRMLLWTTVFIATLGIVTIVPSRMMAQKPTLSAEQCAEVEEAKRLIQQASQLYKQGRYAQAIPIVERALAMQENVLGSEHPDFALSLIALGELHLKMGNQTQAEALFRRSQATRLYTLGSQYSDAVVCQNRSDGARGRRG